MRSRLSSFGALALAVAIAAATAAEEAVRAPLTEEAIVRLYVGGTPVPEILERLAASEVAFDLSDEMVRELELAGLPAELIQAMRLRQAELAPPPAPVAEARVEATEAELSLEIRARASDEGPIVRVAGRVDFQLRERWQLGRELEGAPFEDLALFLACRTPTHVPDHWRTESPIGSDFSVPRHRMHAFHAGAKPSEGELTLTLPDPLTVVLEAGEPHDLSVGLAVAVEDRYYVAAEARLDAVILPAGPCRRFAKIEVSRQHLSETKIEFTNAP